MQSTLLDPNLESGQNTPKLQRLLACNFMKDVTVLIGSPKRLIFDERAQYCCKYKCPNYGTRCFCPPQSLKLANAAKNRQYVVIFAKTYDYSELPHFIHNPGKRTKNYLFNKRVFVRRWVQNHFYNGMKELFSKWGFDHNDIFAGGFALTRCRKCFTGQDNKTAVGSCIPLPSPEALGIDVASSLFQLGYYIKFKDMEKMTKVSMIFTDDNSCEHFADTPGISDKPYKTPSVKYPNLRPILESNFQDVNFQFVKVQQLEEKIKPEFKWLFNWHNAFLWQSNKNNNKFTKSMIHRAVFSQEYYFALDFMVDEVLHSNSGFDKYFGIEFF